MFVKIEENRSPISFADLKSFMRFLTGCESIPAAGIEGGKITVSFNKDGTVFSSAFCISLNYLDELIHTQSSKQR